jgi:hypothetical protein
MFEAACRDYLLWQCSVGGGSSQEKGKLHGMGCVLDSSHVLTARHVWTQIEKNYSWPVVLKFDGLFRCEIALESVAHDIMVLRTAAKLEAVQMETPTTFPSLSSSLLFIGASVGFISALRLHESFQKSTRHTYFGSGSVAFLVCPTDDLAATYALSGCVVQKGMSGSPVFRPDGSLVGVFIETLSFATDILDPASPMYLLPVVSPIRPLLSQIQTLLSEWF